ncbi:hypothetical protein Daus18300_010588 [Diaporthe australafricana]|uniref:Uncharacterized protein n=1 Tax=Diaporthe australafricana TaxID=127596 RepID=A0ABR3W9P9_9PEZI
MPLIWLELFVAVFISWDDNSTLPDYYLADLGQASLDLLSIREGEFAPNGNRDVQSLYMSLSQLVECTGNFPLPGGAIEMQLGQWIERLRRMTFRRDFVAALPDIQGLLHEISAIPAPPVEPSLAAIRRDLIIGGPFVPLLHDTPLAAAMTPYVHGPFYVAEVSMNAATGLPDVVSVDRSRALHRPNAGHAGSDTD